MYEILFRAKVEQKDRLDFIKFFKENIQTAEMCERGTLRFDLYEEEHQAEDKRNGEPNSFLVYETYRDEAAFKAHQKHAPFKRWESEILPNKVTWFARSQFGEPLLSLPSNQQITEAERAFRMKDYELKVGYLTGQFTRMWQRFQFFVALQTALVGGKTVFGDQATIPLAVVGAVISAAWFIIGAEDRYLVRSYRQEANDAARALARCTLEGMDAESYEPVGKLEPRSEGLAAELAKRAPLERMTEWRCEPISITRLPAWLALFALIGWLFVLVVQFKPH
jgi:quinol monooxygenase YgiN